MFLTVTYMMAIKRTEEHDTIDQNESIFGQAALHSATQVRVLKAFWARYGTFLHSHFCLSACKSNVINTDSTKDFVKKLILKTSIY